jgi:LAO/AO transport system kinase
VARAISLVESRDDAALALLQELFPETGSAFAVGITGPPGVGKSSLIGALITHVRTRDLTVGVISIDPSSPFTHGALLGDRIRLSEHFLDPGVFIRSMGARGHLGGVAETTLQSLLLLDAAGTDVVFLETVGAGQSEVEVMSVADEVVLVLMPGSGDSVQALKAGIMEIPDVIAVNKMDQPGAKALQNDIRGVIALDPNAGRRPPIVLTEALRGEGIDTLWSAIAERRDALAADGELEKRRHGNLAGEVVAAATALAHAAIERAIAEDTSLTDLVASVQRREVDPLTAAERVASTVLREATP